MENLLEDLVGDMTLRLENGRVFHYWVIGMTPLNSGRNAGIGVTSVVK